MLQNCLPVSNSQQSPVPFHIFCLLNSWCLQLDFSGVKLSTQKSVDVLAQAAQGRGGVTDPGGV